nr:unnamed protein product [Haemonchus contortus]
MVTGIMKYLSWRLIPPLDHLAIWFGDRVTFSERQNAYSNQQYLHWEGQIRQACTALLLAHTHMRSNRAAVAVVEAKPVNQ